MRFWLSVTFCVIVVTGLSTFLLVSNPDLRRQPAPAAPPPTPVPAADAPKAVPDAIEARIANLPQAYQSSKTFTIKNEGNRVLELTPQTPGCTCASVEVVHERADGGKDFLKLKAAKEHGFDTERSSPSLVHVPVPPGRSATVILGFDTRQRVGDVDVAASVGTNDPVTNPVKFVLHLNVVQDVVVDPAEINFGPLREGQAIQKEVFVYSTLHDNVTVLDPKISNPSISVKLDPMTPEELKAKEAKSGMKATLSVDGKLPVGPVFEKLSFKTPIERAAELSLTMSASVEGNTLVVPAKVDFQVVSVESKHDKKVQIFAKGLNLKEGEHLKLGEIQPSFVVAELTHSPTLPTLWVLAIRLDKNAPAGPFNGAISICDQTGAKRVNVPVQGVVRGVALNAKTGG